MIIDAIVTMTTDFFAFLLSFFPDVNTTITTAIASGYYNIKTLLVGYNWIFPVNTFYFIMNSFLGILLAFGLYKLIRWIASILSAGFIK